MKLFYSPGPARCPPHRLPARPAAARAGQGGSQSQRNTTAAATFWKINSKGYVPALQLDSGQVLTRGRRSSNTSPTRSPMRAWRRKAGSFERSQLQEWLNFITSELHKGFSPRFKPNTPTSTSASQGEPEQPQSSGWTSSSTARTTDGQHLQRRGCYRHGAQLDQAAAVRSPRWAQRHGRTWRASVLAPVQEALR